MSFRALWYALSSAVVFALVLSLTSLRPVIAGQGQGQQNPLVGTYALASPDGQGGVNYSWYTFTADGQYQMVSAVQGGRNNGSVVQRWGIYQMRSVGGNMVQVAVRITGGAPTQICAPGQGCTPVRNIQSQSTFQFQVTPQGLMQGDGSLFQRSQVPPQLQGRLPATRTQAPVVNPNGGSSGSGNGSPTNIPGLGNNCDNAQQNRICTINGGHIYTDKRGCQVCASPY